MGHLIIMHHHKISVIDILDTFLITGVRNFRNRHSANDLIAATKRFLPEAA